MWGAWGSCFCGIYFTVLFMYTVFLKVSWFRGNPILEGKNIWRRKSKISMFVLSQGRFFCVLTLGGLPGKQQTPVCLGCKTGCLPVWGSSFILLLGKQEWFSWGAPVTHSPLEHLEMLDHAFT